MTLTKRIYIFLLVIMLICSLPIAILLAYNGLSYSYYSTLADGVPLVLMKDSLLVHVLLVVLAALAAVVLDYFFEKKLSRKTQERVALGVLIFSVLTILVLGTVYVQMTPYYPEGDQLNTTAGAYYCKAGNYMMLQKGGYIGLYEQQKGFMFLYEILFTLFGDFCYKTAAQFHVLFAGITVLAGYGFVRLQFDKPMTGILYCVLMTFCFPYSILLPYIYGDVPAICFSMVLFWVLAKYAKQYKVRYAVLGAVMATLALMCRMNTWIVLIAVGIGMILLAIRKKCYKPLVVVICILLTAVGSIKAIDFMYEKRSGYESGVGIPSILWIAMGLQETNGSAGVYNRYQQGVFEECDFDREISAQIGKDYITVRLREFADNPAMAKEFFWKKMTSQWTEPLFNSLAPTKTFKEDKPIPGWIQNMYYGPLRDIMWKSANYYQSLVYVAFLLFVAGAFLTVRKEQESSVKWIPFITVLGGFLFSLLWENQCRYCLPYYVFLLLYVPWGILQLRCLLRGLKKSKE